MIKGIWYYIIVIKDMYSMIKDITCHMIIKDVNYVINNICVYNKGVPVRGFLKMISVIIVINNVCL